MLTVEEIAKGLQVEEATVRFWLKTGKLKGAKVGKQWRVSPEDLYEMVPKSSIHGFDDNEHMVSLARKVYHREYEEQQKLHEEQKEPDTRLAWLFEKNLDEIERRFPYPYESREVVNRTEEGQEWIGADKEVSDHYYKTKFKEEMFKFTKLMELLTKKYGVKDADIEEIKRTADNIKILTMAGYDD